MGNLQSAITEDAIYNAFRKYNLQTVRLVTDRETGPYPLLAGKLSSIVIIIIIIIIIIIRSSCRSKVRVQTSCM